VDTDLEGGWEVSPYYDSMLAKLVVWGNNRPEAIARARRALGEFRIAGIPTTLPFFKFLLGQKEFLAGRVHTNYAESNPIEVPQNVETAAILAAALEFGRCELDLPKGAPLSSWRLACAPGDEA
jgi:acetyl/propionyl-CoA carboxylase alpha subunit